MDFAHYQSPKLLGFGPPITQVSIFGTLSISGQINRENLSLTCGDYPVYLGRSAKSKIPDRLGFSRHTKTRLKVEATPPLRINILFSPRTLGGLVNFAEQLACVTCVALGATHTSSCAGCREGFRVLG